MSVRTAAELTADVEERCDVCVVGSGAGGAVLAAGLAEGGLDVVLLEEGGYHTRDDWVQLDEAHSYPMLYQEQMGRATADQAISILQGRSVGGSTTVNWTTCFRTPERILAHWREHHGTQWTAEELDPHWAAVEERLSIDRWSDELVNPNNDALRRGCEALGWQYEVLRRNVDGCVSSGYCGLGCPVDAKQAMHLTYIEDGLAAGMRLYADTRAERIEVAGARARVVHAVVMDNERHVPTEVRVTVRPKVVAVCGGAINSPVLLLKSGLEHGPVGRRTFVHPVVTLPGIYNEPIRGFYGAPQSISSHEFVEPADDAIGFFLEVAPMQPVLSSTALVQFGAFHRHFMNSLSHVVGMIALTVDGLLPGEEGGTVTVRPDGRPRIDYPVGPQLEQAFREGMQAMALVHLAAGCREAVSAHLDPVRVRSEADLDALAAAPYGAHEHTIFTAHQMGGCATGGDPARSVVDLELRHRQVPNLFVVDGSVLPTALGVNPSLTIYGIAHWARERVGSAV